jgi:hypothetical protein
MAASCLAEDAFSRSCDASSLAAAAAAAVAAVNSARRDCSLRAAAAATSVASFIVARAPFYSVVYIARRMI